METKVFNAINRNSPGCSLKRKEVKIMDCPRCGSENVHWEVVEEVEGKGFVWEAECEECDWEDTKYVF